MYKIQFKLFKFGISFVTNAKYIADFFAKESKKCTITTIDSIQSTDDGYIEKMTPDSNIGVVSFPGEAIQGYTNYYGKNIPILQIYSFDNMQPVRVFVNYITAKKLSKFCLPIHASTINAENVGVSFMGNKDSGKSTLSISNVLWHDSSLVSDDITFLYKRKEKNMIVADGIFNGAHIFETEKYIYENKVFIKNRDHDEYIKKRLIFNKNCVSGEVILKTIIINKINETKNDFAFKKLEITQALQELKNNVIRFANIEYDRFDDILCSLINQSSVYAVSTGNNFIESAEQIHNLIIKLGNQL